MAIHQIHLVPGVFAVVTDIVPPVCIIVAFNMARKLTPKDDMYCFESLKDICKLLLHLCDAKAVQQNPDPMMVVSGGGDRVDPETFWGDPRWGSWIKYEYQDNIGEAVNLNQIVGIAYALCNYIWPMYEKVSHTLEELIVHRLVPKSDDFDNDQVDGGVEEIVQGGADGEAYLRRLYLVLRSQGMVSSNECAFFGFFGCCQQCLYVCVCFCLLVCVLYQGDRTNMPLIDWVNHVILSGGCAKVLSEQSLGLMEWIMLNSIGENVSTKSMARCVFDLVNTKNPSNGMIGPGNCQWFHNIVLRLTGGVNEEVEKVMKNHAVIHDACGFMLTHTDIGPGYVFGLFLHAVVNVSSAGASRSSVVHWLVSISAMGQFSGLVAMYYLMKHLRAPFLNAYNNQDRQECCVKDINFTNLSSNGGSRSSV